MSRRAIDHTVSGELAEGMQATSFLKTCADRFEDVIAWSEQHWPEPSPAVISHRGPIWAADAVAHA